MPTNPTPTPIEWREQLRQDLARAEIEMEIQAHQEKGGDSLLRRIVGYARALAREWDAHEPSPDLGGWCPICKVQAHNGCPAKRRMMQNTYAE